MNSLPCIVKSHFFSRLSIPQNNVKTTKNTLKRMQSQSATSFSSISSSNSDASNQTNAPSSKTHSNSEKKTSNRMSSYLAQFKPKSNPLGFGIRPVLSTLLPLLKFKKYSDIKRSTTVEQVIVGAELEIREEEAVDTNETNMKMNVKESEQINDETRNKIEMNNENRMRSERVSETSVPENCVAINTANTRHHNDDTLISPPCPSSTPSFSTSFSSSPCHSHSAIPNPIADCNREEVKVEKRGENKVENKVEFRGRRLRDQAVPSSISSDSDTHEQPPTRTHTNIEKLVAHSSSRLNYLFRRHSTTPKSSIRFTAAQPVIQERSNSNPVSTERSSECSDFLPIDPDGIDLLIRNSQFENWQRDEKIKNFLDQQFELDSQEKRNSVASSGGSASADMGIDIDSNEIENAMTQLENEKGNTRKEVKNKSESKILKNNITEVSNDRTPKSRSNSKSDMARLSCDERHIEFHRNKATSVISDHNIDDYSYDPTYVTHSHYQSNIGIGHRNALRPLSITDNIATSNGDVRTPEKTCVEKQNKRHTSRDYDTKREKKSSAFSLPPISADNHSVQYVPISGTPNVMASPIGSTPSVPNMTAKNNEIEVHNFNSTNEFSTQSTSAHTQNNTRSNTHSRVSSRRNSYNSTTDNIEDEKKSLEFKLFFNSAIFEFNNTSSSSAPTTSSSQRTSSLSTLNPPTPVLSNSFNNSNSNHRHIRQSITPLLSTEFMLSSPSPIMTPNKNGRFFDEANLVYINSKSGPI